MLFVVRVCNLTHIQTIFLPLPDGLPSILRQSHLGLKWGKLIAVLERLETRYMATDKMSMVLAWNR